MVLFSFIYLFSSIGTRFRIATKSPIPTLVACSTLTFGLAFVCCVFLFVFVFVYVFLFICIFRENPMQEKALERGDVSLCFLVFPLTLCKPRQNET